MQTQGTETSKYLEEEQITYDFASSGERTRNSPNHSNYGYCGVVGLQCGLLIGSGIGLERPTIGGDSPVHETN